MGRADRLRSTSALGRLLTVTKGAFGPEVDIRLATTDPGNDSSFAMDPQASPTAELLTCKSKMLELEIQKY